MSTPDTTTVLAVAATFVIGLKEAVPDAWYIRNPVVLVDVGASHDKVRFVSVAAKDDVLGHKKNKTAKKRSKGNRPCLIG